MQPFEFVISIMIADLASIPMSDTGIPITNGIIPILALLLIDLLISLINIKSINGRKLICGKPTILITRGKIEEKNLKKEKVTINELQERLREKDVFNLADVEYAILETSGQLTVVQKPTKRNAIPEDFGIEPQYEGMPYDLVVDGKIMFKNLKKLGKDDNWLLEQIKQMNTDVKNILILTINGKNEMFCQIKEE